MALFVNGCGGSQGSIKGERAHGTSWNKSFHVEPRSRSIKLVEEVVTIKVGILLQNITNLAEKDVFRRRPWGTLNWRNKGETWVKIQGTFCMRLWGTRKGNTCLEWSPSRRCLSSFGRRRKPLTSLVVNHWVRCHQLALAARLHSILKMRPNQRVIKIG